MAKKAKNNTAVRVIYGFLLFLFGVLLWTYWQGKSRDYRPVSEKLDASVGTVLSDSGVRASAIERSKKEKKTGSRIWTEHEREIRLLQGKDVSKLIGDIRQAAEKLRVGAYTVITDSGTRRSLEVRVKDMVLSHVVFVAAPVAEPARGALTGKKRFALVIDDIGGSRHIEQYLDLGVPVTFAIMPFERYGKEIAAELAKQNRPFLLHLPMEPQAYPQVNPGAAALLLKMSPDELRAKFERDLATVPGACGVSNHMGSAFSGNAEKMKQLLTLVREKELFYFDSCTTPKTTASKVARQMSVPVAVNDVFVDVKDEPEYMRKQYDYILKRFKKQDSFIAIGHIQKKNMVPVLKEYIPRFREEGIEFVYLTDLIPSLKRNGR